MSSADPAVHVRVTLLSVDAWNLAATTAAPQTARPPHAGADGPVPQGRITAPDKAWDELLAAGVATGKGRLDAGWAAVIAEHFEPLVSFRVISVYRELMYLADVSVAGHSSSCLLRRLKVASQPDGTMAPVGADPELEFAVTRPDGPWSLVRRVLPPLDVLRAPALHTPPSEVTTVLLPGPDDPPSDALVQEAVDTVRNPVASVTLLSAAGGPDATELGLGTWVTDGSALWNVQPRQGRSAISRVRPGEIAAELDWYVLGGLDVAVAARSRGDR